MLITTLRRQWRELRTSWHGFRWEIPHFQWRYDLEEGARIPKWYGFSYYDHVRGVAVCNPTPFHLLLSLWRRFFTWYQWGFGYWGNEHEKEIMGLRAENAALNNKLKFANAAYDKSVDTLVRSQSNPS